MWAHRISRLLYYRLNSVLFNHFYNHCVLNISNCKKQIKTIWKNDENPDYWCCYCSVLRLLWVLCGVDKRRGGAAPFISEPNLTEKSAERSRLPRLIQYKSHDTILPWTKHIRTDLTQVWADETRVWTYQLCHCHTQTALEINSNILKDNVTSPLKKCWLQRNNKKLF